MATQDETDAFLDGLAWTLENIQTWVFLAGFCFGLIAGTFVTLVMML